MKSSNLKISTVLIVFVAASLGWAFKESKYFTIETSMEVYANLFKEVTKTYVDEIGAAGLMKEGLDGMLKKLDPFTNYISEAKIEEYKLKKAENVADIGAEFIVRDRKVYISKILAEMPAHKNGLEVGDEVLLIDDAEVSNRTVEQIGLATKGDAGSFIKLDVRKNGKTEIFRIIRENQQAKNVTYYQMLNDSIGYVHLSSFTPNCGKFVGNAINSLNKDKALKGLVFDLRNNGGGLLKEAIMVSNLFIDQDKVVVSTKGATEDWNKTYKAPVQPILKDLPFTILTNKKSASASEIVSGVMQDYDRAIVVGNRTYGKGLVQQTKDIGFNSKLKLTVAKYYLPSGRCVQAVDYTGRYTDAGPQTINDSLRNEFTTDNGRLVHDNSGVTPDIEVEAPKLSFITQQLISNFAFFDFVNDFKSQHDSIQSPTTFSISDELFNEFIAFVQKGDYPVETKTEKLVRRLVDRAEDSEQLANIKEDLDRMLVTLEGEETELIRSFEDEVKRQLKNNIIERYYFEKGLLEASLNDDIYIKQALNVMADKGYYNSILAGS